MPVAAMIDFSMPETEPKYRISAPSAEASSINGSKGTTCPADPPPVNASLLPANVFPWSCVTIQLIRMSKREVRPNDVAPPSYRPPRINEHCQRPPCHRSERQINCLYPAIMPAMPSDPYQMLQLKGSTVETFDEGVWSRPNDRCRSARRRSDRDRPRATTVRSWPIDCAREPSGIRALHVAPPNNVGRRSSHCPLGLRRHPQAKLLAKAVTWTLDFRRAFGPSNALYIASCAPYELDPERERYDSAHPSNSANDCASAPRRIPRWRMFATHSASSTSIQTSADAAGRISETIQP